MSQEPMNVTSSLYDNYVAPKANNIRASNTAESASLEGEVRNIDEDHKTTVSNNSQGDDDKFPTFPNNYHATGIIILPESKIAEPFEIWYAPDSKKSRIDYYYGKLRIPFFGKFK